MTGERKSVQRRLPATSASRGCKAYIYKHQSDPSRYPIVVLERIDEETARNATKLSGHKGNVLLEDVKLGQRVFLNASFILDQPFIFEPLVTEFQQYMLETATETSMHTLQQVYEDLREKTLAMLPKLRTFIEDSTSHPELFKFMRSCEMTAALKQLCFGEPVPLIDMASVKNKTLNTAEPASSTKARKIAKPAPLGTNQGNATGAKSKNMGGAAKGETPSGEKGSFTIPCIITEGNQKTYYAFSRAALNDADRLAMPLAPIMNVQGMLVTSEPLLMKMVHNFKERVETEKLALLQEYRDMYQACNQFIKKEGTTRTDDEWLEFITNCVHVHALRHVLYGKQLHASLPGQDSETNQVLRMLDAMVLCSGKSHDKYLKEPPVGLDSRVRYDRAPDGELGMSREDLGHVPVIRVVFEGSGTPHPIRTSGSQLKEMLQFAEDACKHDIATAKKNYAQLTKRCYKTVEEETNLIDRATIGIPEAAKELKSWANDCLYLCALKRVLHDAPLKAFIGNDGNA